MIQGITLSQGISDLMFPVLFQVDLNPCILLQLTATSSPSTTPASSVQTSPRLFLTSKAYSPSAINGIAGADAICTMEAGGAAAKALLVDETGCNGRPCRRATISPNTGDGQIDWPLMPNTAYYNADFSAVVATTGANGLLPSTLLVAITAPGCLNQASGLNKDWTTRSGLTCGGWQQPSGQQAVGWICSNDLSTTDLLNGGYVQCSSASRLLCVTTPTTPPFPPSPPPGPPPSPPPPRPPFQILEISNYVPYIAGGPHIVAYCGLRLCIVVSDGVSVIVVGSLVPPLFPSPLCCSASPSLSEHHVYHNNVLSYFLMRLVSCSLGAGSIQPGSE